MLNKILVTGATGFVGSHLLELLNKKENSEIFGTYFSDSSLDNLGNLKEKIKLEKIDLNSQEKVFDLVRKIKPYAIYHLAALSSAADSFKNPKETIENNISSQVNLLEGVRKNKLLETKILIVSSAEVYGMVSEEKLPIAEETPFNPTNPYAVSKITQDMLGLEYFLAYQLKTIRVRPFNHVGPRQAPNFVISTFAKKIADIEKGNSEPVMRVGNLNAKRDFTDVRDMVKAYILLMEKGIAGEVYNIGSGKSYKISDILNKLLSFSKVNIKVEVDKELFRPIDNPDLVSDTSKFKKLTGWEPEISIEKTLKDTLDYWRDII